MKNAKSLSTKYNGYHFRSRTEARWAVFFDALGIKYYYEHEDFVLQNGVRYLPDFWLPTFNGGSFAEVKGEFEGDEIYKCKLLYTKTKKDVILLDGVPDFKCVQYFTNNGMNGRCFLNNGLICADQAAGENRMFAQPGYENKDLTIPSDYIECLGETFFNAVMASRSARFEFNN